MHSDVGKGFQQAATASMSSLVRNVKALQDSVEAGSSAGQPLRSSVGTEAGAASMADVRSSLSPSEKAMEENMRKIRAVKEVKSPIIIDAKARLIEVQQCDIEESSDSSREESAEPEVKSALSMTPKVGNRSPAVIDLDADVIDHESRSSPGVGYDEETVRRRPSKLTEYNEEAPAEKEPSEESPTTRKKKAEHEAIKKKNLSRELVG